MQGKLGQFEPLLFGAFRRLLLARARDVTAEMDSASALVIAPHPDDETLGCGGTIARKVRAGKRVDVVIVCDGRHSHVSAKLSPEELARIRREEAVAACAALGVPAGRVHFLACEDRHVAQNARAVAEGLAKLVERIRPEQVLAPSGIDMHPDHRALHGIVADLMDAGRIACPVYEYPVWFWAASTWITPRHGRARKLVQAVWRPLRFGVASRPMIVRTADVVDRKRAAMAAYRSQLESLTGEADWPVLQEEFLAAFYRPAEILFPFRRIARPAAAAGPRGEAAPDAATAGAVWGWPA